jgi:ATP-dependent Clp protease ATP-binding subunit ClpA
VISKELEIALHDCFVEARGKYHKWITVEHLLLQLVDMQSVQERLRSSGIDVQALRTDLETCVSRSETVPKTEDPDTQPTMPFQKVIQYAILSVQEGERDEVVPTDILDAVVAHADGLKLDRSVQLRIASIKGSRK